MPPCIHTHATNQLAHWHSLQAYLRAVAARTGDDIFRILSVRMLEPLIFECIQYSLNLFRSEKIVKEADKQTACVGGTVLDLSWWVW